MLAAMSFQGACKFCQLPDRKGITEAEPHSWNNAISELTSRAPIWASLCSHTQITDSGFMKTSFATQINDEMQNSCLVCKYPRCKHA